MDDDTSAPLGTEEALAIIADQRAAAARTQPSAPLLFGVWGTAWVLGYGLLWLSVGDDDTWAAWAAVVAGAVIVAAMVVTAVHCIRRTHGIRGRSAEQGAMYGWSWFLGFLGQGVIVAALANAGASREVVGLAANAIAALVVGLLYIAGGLMWRAIAMYALGAWILLAGAAGAFAGIPDSYAVLALAGGGGMLVAALVTRVRDGRAGA
ncbi:hypothetical protein [Cellulomonas palmilytica]|uniref:hypothetical protein n=1 Tax=Cellulomonas palmilytica TaxID=2608402 RepID=UPI001F1D4D73|nr:hypothetical protein [Cellulomonas palmilytica]UJP40504.1 hypothetical protein F1D97_03010 [Cellulomonas palmilytica]